MVFKDLKNRVDLLLKQLAKVNTVPCICCIGTIETIESMEYEIEDLKVLSRKFKFCEHLYWTRLLGLAVEISIRYIK